MKFTKFGKALLMSALSVGIILGITSCVQSYSVGYLYVTGTNNAASSNNGIISGFKIDHNKGKLTPIHGLPVASGGANPGRAVLSHGGRFIYVLNRGKNSSGTADCTTADPCLGAQYHAVLDRRQRHPLAAGQTFYPQGINPIRIVHRQFGQLSLRAGSRSRLTALPALSALGSGVTSCGDITAFKIDSNTGRLTLVVNCAGDLGQRTGAAVLPCSGQPDRFRPDRRAISSR